MKILLIAPKHAELPSLDSEIAAVMRFHDVEPVIGLVRESEITEAIGKHPDGFDCIWFASHGSAAGVLLSDDVLSPDGVGQYLGASGAQLCVLNTCDNESIARQIIVGTKCDIVYVVSAVTDTDAVRFGSIFAAELSKTDDFHEAFAIAAPLGGKYKYLEAKAAVRKLDMEVSTDVKRLDKALYELQVDARTDRTNVLEIRGKLDTLIQKLDAMSQTAAITSAQAAAALVSQTAQAAAQAASILAMQTAQAASQLAASKAEAQATQPIPITSWIIIGLLAAILVTGLFFAVRIL